MLTRVVIYGLIAGPFLTGAFSLWKGGPAERAGGVSILVIWLATFLGVQAVSEPGARLWIIIASDTVASSVFLYLALRYANGWLGAAMVLQGIALSLHGLQSAGAGTSDLGYAALINVIGFLVLATICAGTAVSWSRRRSGRGCAPVSARMVAPG